MRDDRVLVEDIRDAIAVIRRYTPAERSAFDADPPLQSHLLRHIQIVGEASWRISPSLKTANPQVPWLRIAAMRHVLVHDYFRVDLNQVWNVATVHIPVLERQIEAILNGLPPEPGSGSAADAGKASGAETSAEPVPEREADSRPGADAGGKPALGSENKPGPDAA